MTSYHPASQQPNGTIVMNIIRPLERDRAAPFAADVFANPVHPLASMMVAMCYAWCSFKARRTLRAAKAELMALDDHSLKDIGLDRSEIESALTDCARERRNAAPLPLVVSPRCCHVAS